MTDEINDTKKSEIAQIVRDLRLDVCPQCGSASDDMLATGLSQAFDAGHEQAVDLSDLGHLRAEYRRQNSELLAVGHDLRKARAELTSARRELDESRSEVREARANARDNFL